MAKKEKGKIGSSFEDFLKDDGIYEAVTAVAEKRVIAWQIQEAMKAQKITKQNNLQLCLQMLLQLMQEQEVERLQVSTV